MPAPQPRSSDRLHPRRGAALVLGLMVVVVVMILAGTFTRFASVITRSSVEGMDRKRAFYVAEAGLAEAYTALWQAKSGNVGSMEEPAVFGDGLFWVEASEPGPGLVQLESTGMVAGGRAVLSLVVERGETSVANLGLYADAALLLLPGTFVDGYDSGEGSYDDPAQVHTSGVIGSNGPITVEGQLEKPTKVYGDVTPGPSEAVEVLGEGVTITGSVSPALEAAQLPPVDVPQVDMLGGMTFESPTPLVVPPGTRAHEFLTIAPNAEVTFQGPATIVLGSLGLQESAQLTFDTSQGAVQLYVLDTLELQRGSQVITPDADPSRVTIQVPEGAQGGVILGGNSSFYGVIYAPGSMVKMGAGFELFGALIGKELVLGAGSQLHFDTHLADLAAQLALPKQLSWEVLDLTSESSNLLADPFDLLGVDRAALPKPAEAHEDQWLELAYEDLSGAVQTYAGWESAFDWSQVAQVLKGTRDGEPFALPGDTDSGNVQDPSAVAPNPDPLIDDLNDDTLTETEIWDRLLANCPLSADVIITAIEREPPLSSSVLKDVLIATAPIPLEAMRNVIHVADLGSSELRDVLIASSPLDPAVLTSLDTRDPPMNASHRADVEAAQ